MEKGPYNDDGLAQEPVDLTEKGKISVHFWGLNSESLSPQPSSCTDYTIAGNEGEKIHLKFYNSNLKFMDYFGILKWKIILQVKIC